MPLEERSTATLEFAEQLRHRLLGNADDQRLCLGAPNRLLEYGILFSQYEAGKSRRGARTDIRPNALTVRFEVAGDAPVLLTLRPSFWLYARSQSAHLPPANAGDLFTPEIVWADWGDRPSPILAQGRAHHARHDDKHGRRVLH